MDTHAGHAATDSDWPRSDTVVGFVTRRTCCRRIACPSVPSVTCNGCRASPQWKTAAIAPIPKIAAPALPSDFRPISITPVLSRFVVREFLYPALLQPCPSSSSSSTNFIATEQNFRAAMCHVLHYSCNVNAAVADSLRCRMIWEQFRVQCTLECPQRRQQRDRRRQRIPNLCRGNGEGAIADGPVQRPWNMQRR